MALDVDFDQIDCQIRRQKIVDRGHVDLDRMLRAAQQVYARHGAAGGQVRRVMQNAAAALAGDQHVYRDDVRVEIKIVGGDRALQALEDARVALESIEPPAIPDDAGTERGVEPEMGADVEDDRALRQKRPEDANDVRFVLLAEDIAEPLECSRVDAEIFARGEPHQRPIRSDGDRTAIPHPPPPGGGRLGPHPVRLTWDAGAGSPQSADSTHSRSLLLGKAPILVAATWPSLKRIMVGMPRTPYFIGVCGFSSILTFATVTLPAMSVASSSRNGPIMRHGPHHSAQKSTTTGPLARSTSASKLLSVTAIGFISCSLGLTTSQ